MEGLFHVHSNYSYDGKFSLEEIKAECLKKGYRFVILTDHAESFGPMAMGEYIKHCEEISDKKFLAIPGLEFNIDDDNEVHLLVIGLEDILNEGNVEDILLKIKSGKHDGLAVVAHPSRSNYYVPPEFENKIDGIEIWNAAYNSRYLPDDKSIRLFGRLKKKNDHFLGFGGLDLHDRSGFRDVRICLTQLCRNRQELLDCLKNGKFMIRGPYLSISSKPCFGIFKISLIRFGRKTLLIADSIKWKTKGWKNIFLKAIFSDKA